MRSIRRAPPVAGDMRDPGNAAEPIGQEGPPSHREAESGMRSGRVVHALEPPQSHRGVLGGSRYRDFGYPVGAMLAWRPCGQARGKQRSRYASIESWALDPARAASRKPKTPTAADVRAVLIRMLTSRTDRQGALSNVPASGWRLGRTYERAILAAAHRPGASLFLLTRLIHVWNYGFFGPGLVCVHLSPAQQYVLGGYRPLHAHRSSTARSRRLTFLAATRGHRRMMPVVNNVKVAW